nr:hypothetical protein CFP56_26894 [Quercus suber]
MTVISLNEKEGCFMGFENWRASLKQSWFKMDLSTSSNLEVFCTLTESGMNEIGPEIGTFLQGLGSKIQTLVIFLDFNSPMAASGTGRLSPSSSL